MGRELGSPQCTSSAWQPGVRFEIPTADKPKRGDKGTSSLMRLAYLEVQGARDVRYGAG